MYLISILLNKTKKGSFVQEMLITLCVGLGITFGEGEDFLIELVSRGLGQVLVISALGTLKNKVF